MRIKIANLKKTKQRHKQYYIPHGGIPHLISYNSAKVKGSPTIHIIIFLEIGLVNILHTTQNLRAYIHTNRVTRNKRA